MKRLILVVFLILASIITLTSCSAGEEGDREAGLTEVTQDQETLRPTLTQPSLATDTASPVPSLTPSQEATVTKTEDRLTETPPPATATTESYKPTSTHMVFHDLSLSADEIFFFPVPDLIEGDLVSVEVAPTIPGGLAPNDIDVQILVDDEEIYRGIIDWRKLNGDTVGLFQWVWDTEGKAGEHSVTAILDPANTIQIGDEDPDNNQVTIEVEILPLPGGPSKIEEPRWITTTVHCCVIHTVSDTAAQRDLEVLIPVVDAAFDQASRKLVEPLSTPYHVYVVDRVFGQGGYTIDNMVVSYLDRNYAGGKLFELLAHEATHVIDKEFAPNTITFLSEGVAVWVAGGHYAQQDLGQRMAALVELGRYVPLTNVINNFFSTQHEISYLEGASLIDYLVETYGWTAVRKFYSETTADDGPSLAEAVDYNLRFYFGASLEQVQTDWLSYLEDLPRDRAAREDLRTTLRYYDVMRRYQIAYDPSAYYLYAWLPAPEVAEERNATADFTRHPDGDINISLEAMLGSANQALLAGNFVQANALLESVDTVIDNDGRFLDPLSRSYMNIVTGMHGLGYEVQKLDVNGSGATVLVTQASGTELTRLRLILDDDQSWTLLP